MKKLTQLINEGAWGYKPHKSDDYLDMAHKFAEPIVKALLKGLNDKDNNIVYNFMGYTNECLRMHNIMGETLYWSKDDPNEEQIGGYGEKKTRQNYGIQLKHAFENAYDRLSKEYDKLGWKDPEQFKYALDIVKDCFDNLMDERKDGKSEEELEEYRKKWKERDKLFYEKPEIEELKTNR